jgi:hypothetical protein
MIGFWFRVSTLTHDSGVEDLVDHVSTLKIKVNVGGVEVAARQPPLLMVLDPSTSSLVTSCIHVLLRAQPFKIYKSFGHRDCHCSFITRRLLEAFIGTKFHPNFQNPSCFRKATIYPPRQEERTARLTRAFLPLDEP